MLKANVYVGSVYAATISGKRTKVRIVGERTNLRTNRTYWYAVNLATNRDVIIKSAAALTELKKAG